MEQQEAESALKMQGSFICPCCGECYPAENFNNKWPQKWNVYKAAPELHELAKLTVGFCIDFRQNKDWENHPEVGILFAKATTILAKAEGRE